MKHVQTLFFILHFSLFNATITYDEITKDLKNDIIYYLENIGGDFTVGNLVRYGFHTCVTGCNGCINLHNPNNAGLQPAYNATIGLYSDKSLPSGIIWSTKVENLADFWTLCTTVGNFIAIPDGQFVPDFRFWTGRKACSTSPNQTLMAPFPDPIKGLSAQSEFFGEVFNLTQPQYIALIGGHTLGKAHSTASGFDTLPWTVSPTILDNTFYTELIGFPWIQQAAVENGLYEWEHVGSDNGYFMFNSDVCIYKNLLEMNATNGKATCDYNDCPIREETQKQIESYANNQTLWLIEYAQAWNIMMLAQCDVNILTPILPQ
eukprot:86310_1